VFVPPLILYYDCSESAATLEAESGYSMETPEVSDFRQYIVDGLWGKAEAALMRLAVSDEALSVNPYPSTQLNSLMSHPGCQVPNKPAEIPRAAGSEEDNGRTPRFAQRACAVEC
jgi:hypothetical protein